MFRRLPLLRNALVSGATSALASTAMLTWHGRRETRSPFAPINAVSHWLFGDRATMRRRNTR